MFVSPLVRQLVRSLRQQPEIWERDGRTLRRADGVVIQFINPYEHRAAKPRLAAPREVQFGGAEGWYLKRAIRGWLHRPL